MIFIIFSLLIIIFFAAVLIFSSKRFSPIPYFPSNKKDLSLIIHCLKLKNEQTIFDLGAGDGIVIFESAKQALRKKLDTKFIAVEINPILILILHLRRFFHPNKQNIRIIFGDFFKFHLNNLTSKVKNLTIYLYISPWFLDEVAKKILQEFHKARIVSYMYPIRSLEKGKEKIIRGKNSIFVYL